jgi:uncharacterized protein YegP (UPF0339 family)
MKIEIYQRADGKWAWRVRASNGQVVATDGGQGYENRDEAQRMVLSITDPEVVTSVEVI